MRYRRAMMNIELAGHYSHRRILRSVLPSIGMVLVTSIYSIVDGFFVANFAGKTGFAAINLTFPAIMMIGSLGLMIGTGGAALVAKIKGEGYPEKAFYQMPFVGVKGYHSKTLAYSIWHIFRIEDIVAHEMIADDEQILFCKKFLEKTEAPVITTGNELEGEEIAEFSKQLNINELYLYAKDVKESTDKILNGLSYKESKQRYGDDVKEKLILSKCVSEDENAFWLIDYWCGKDIRGLIQMPFSRHWIMHIEACLRIKDKIRH